MSSNRDLAWSALGILLSGAASAAGSSAVYWYANSRKQADDEKISQHEKNRIQAEIAQKTGCAYLEKAQYDKALKEFHKAEVFYDKYCSEDKAADSDLVIKDSKIALLYNQAQCLFHLREYGSEDSPGTALCLLKILLSMSEEVDKDAINLKGLIYLRLAFFDEKLEFLDKAIEAFNQSLSTKQGGQCQRDICNLLYFSKTLKITAPCETKEMKHEHLDELYENISEHSEIERDDITNELPMIYAIAHMNKKGDTQQNLVLAYAWMHYAIMSTRDNPAFRIEKSKLYKFLGKICEALANHIPNGQEIQVNIPPSQNIMQHKLTKEVVLNLAKEYSEKSLKKQNEQQRLQAGLESFGQFAKSSQANTGQQEAAKPSRCVVM